MEEESLDLCHGKGKILVMEDEEIIQRLISTVLEMQGYTYEIANDGQEAIELYKKAMTQKHPFDLVIMDLTIPGGMGGEEAIKRLFDIDTKVKALVSSGYSKDPIMTRYREYGFSGVIAKPYNIHELTQALQRLLSNP